MTTPLEMGPILYFRSLTAEHCTLTAIVVTPGDSAPPPLCVGRDEGVPALWLYGRGGKSVWQYTFAVGLKGAGPTATYAIGPQTWSLHLPRLPHLRIACCSCNGEARDRPGDDDPLRNERWRHLAAEHAANPLHLLLQTGDQLYADDVWRDVPALARWQQLDRDAQLQADWTPELAEAVADFYFDRYCRLWSQPDLAPLLASIPSLMMWDDHDIFDGWGSHAPGLQQCPVFQGLWSVARTFFILFQLGAVDTALPNTIGDPKGRHFGQAVTLGEVGIILVDLRSERTSDQVMGEWGWAWLRQALAQMASCRQVLFVSSVPLVHLDWTIPEHVLRYLQWFRHYHDDIRDQWRSHCHWDEWRRLVTALLDFSDYTHTRLTVLSGETHLGSMGLIERDDTRIYQLVSSGVVHHPPSAKVAALFGLWSRFSGTAFNDITVQLCPMPSLNKRFLAARNWLSLDYDPERSLQAIWHAEGSDGDLHLRLSYLN